ncbi:MAG: DNA repair protein RecO [Chloroflexi bacterium]|nr:MAG: DNA repair protein RecO [Chloroflexota bacterium]
MASSGRTLHTEVVVLRHTDWGEADRLLVLFSREAGKLRAVAKGARKLRSRKAGHLEPFTRVKLLMASGRDFWIITQAETVDAYLPIREDLVRTAYAAYVIELIDRFTYEEGENRPLFQLLIDTLGRIAALPDAFPAVRYYEIRLLDLLGFRPELTNCVRCGAQIQPENQFFDADLGGVLCPRCGANVPAAHPISMPALKFLRHYQRSTFHEASRAALTPAVQREVEALLNYYLTYLLERRLNSPAFLHEVRRDFSDHL